MDRSEFEAKTGTIRKWLDHRTVNTERLVEELDFWREYMADVPAVPTPAPGQIWDRLGSEQRKVHVEAFVDSALGQLVVFTWCAFGSGFANPQVEYVETFLRRCTYSHGGPE